MNKIVLLVLLCFSFYTHAVTYESDNGNACLERDNIVGNLIPHLMSEKSGIFSNTNKCWYMASGDISIMTLKGTTVVYATWVPFKYIDFEPNDDTSSNNEQLTKPEGLLPNTHVEAKLAYNYYVASRQKYCDSNPTVVCANVSCNNPRSTMNVSELTCDNNYYTCYMTNTDYPQIGDATCTLKEGYFIDGTRVRSCSLYPENPACKTEENNNTENNNNNTGGGGSGTGTGTGENNGNNSSGNSSNVDLTAIALDVTQIKDNTEKLLDSANDSLTVSNAILDESKKLTDNTDILVEQGEKTAETLTQIESHTDKLVTSNEALLTQAKLTNSVLSDIYYSNEDILTAVNGVSTDVQQNSAITRQVADNTKSLAQSTNALVSETQNQHDDINNNHNALMNKLNNLSVKADIGDFSSSDDQSLNTTFNTSSGQYEKDSLSLVDSALSTLTNNIPDLAIMFKLPSSFYGDSYGRCKVLNTQLDFNFPFSAQTYSMQFSTETLCKQYDTHFRGIVDFLLAFLTALSVFRLYHRYSSSH